MNVFFAQIRQMIIPGRGGEYGPLPPLLVAMTMVTGLVDAFSYLVLGHVFVANMTGHVVFLAFALIGGSWRLIDGGDDARTALPHGNCGQERGAWLADIACLINEP